uniref:Uncharacterized protein n=1 Tax=Oryza punctata TaxID=4537 RepID=A0A0E0MAX3_ORYPU
MTVRRSCRALQSQYWRAWLTSKNLPFAMGAIGPGLSAWNKASHILFSECSAPSSLSTAYTLIPPYRRPKPFMVSQGRYQWKRSSKKVSFVPCHGFLFLLLPLHMFGDMGRKISAKKMFS